MGESEARDVARGATVTELQEDEGGHPLRSIVAVIGGIFVGAVCTIGTDGVLRAIHVYPSAGASMTAGLFVLAAGHRAVWAVLASLVAGRIGRPRPMLHAMIVGGLNLLVNAAGTLATWHKGPEFGPKWYPILLTALALPCAWVGGRLAARGSSVRVPSGGSTL